MEVISILLLVLAAGINYPVLADFGIILGQLLTLVVDSGQTDIAVKALSTPGSCKLDEFARRDRIQEALTTTHSAFVIIPYLGRKGRTFIEELITIVRTEPITAIPVLVTEKTFVEDPDNLQFFAFISGDLSIVYVTGKFPDWRSVVPPAEMLPVVDEKIKELVISELSPTARFWTAAACFIYPSQKQNEGSFDSILNVVRQMLEFDENCRETKGLANQFVEELYVWRRKTNFTSVYALSSLETEEIVKKGDSVFYDKDNLYIPEKLFKVICSPICELVPIGVIKQCLRDEGLLLVDRSRGYTVKRTYHLPDGKCGQTRLMRFSRNKAKKTGALDFIDECKARKDKPGTSTDPSKRIRAVGTLKVHKVCFRGDFGQKEIPTNCRDLK